MTRKHVSLLMGSILVAVGLANVGCAAPTVPEQHGNTNSSQRIGPPLGPMLRGPGSLPKMQLRAPGQLGKKADPCDVPRGEARGDGCSGNPGDSYEPAAGCDSSSDSTCPSSNVRPGHFINNTTDPKTTPEDQSDPNKLYAENDPNAAKEASTGEERTAANTDEERTDSTRTTDVAERKPEDDAEPPPFDTAGEIGESCPDCA